MTGGNMQTLGSDIAPPNARGRFYGVSQTLGNLGGPLATSAFALLSATLGYWSAFAFLGTTAAGAAFVLGTQVRDRVREQRRGIEGAPSPAAAAAAPAAGASSSALRP
jgi:MFS family permease